MNRLNQLRSHVTTQHTATTHSTKREHSQQQQRFSQVKRIRTSREIASTTLHYYYAVLAPIGLA